MKLSVFIAIVILAVTSSGNANPIVGQICHANAEYVKYNYAGLWEKDSNSNLFCNYQQFMPKSEAIASLRELEPEVEESDEDDELEWEERESEYDKEKKSEDDGYE